MTFTVTALLCLGLTLGLRTTVLAGALPKPVLTVQPDSVVYKQTTVTFFCEVPTGAKAYRLYKVENQKLKHIEFLQNPKDKAEFSISKIDQKHAGQYRCQYQINDGWLSEYSDSLELVVTGVYSKPSLSAQPSPVVSEGRNVTLQCVSGQSHHSFVLVKEGPQKLSWMLDSQYNRYSRQFQALFSVGPVTSRQRWTFRCYSFNKNRPQLWSEPSDPLELLVSGTLHKPTIKAEPGSVVTYKSAMTIWCEGTLDAEICVLHKEGSQNPLDTQTPEKPEKKAKFSIPSVTQQHGGQYRCYCYSSAGWSERSDTLEIVVTDHVTPDHRGTFRCYGYYNHTPHLWSVSSEPLEIHISGPIIASSLPTSLPMPTAASENQDHTVENLIRMGFAAMILIVLGILLFEA